MKRKLFAGLLGFAICSQAGLAAEPEKVHEGAAGSHAHAGWMTPPGNYAGRRGLLWSDAEAIRRGRVIYGRKCAACHGWDGKGTGRMAESLPHPPADLTAHYHRAGKQGDDYLFWRVSEGGMVEPFRLMKSVMPAFRGVLSEQERWEVLAYVHNAFHGEEGGRAQGQDWEETAGERHRH